ncbi:MAG: ribbon-helix-helix protein, CopG family [Deltaproteobacteria bacterium]|nr:ribbon-helix-helix protein, CopG family [Deltaproteobacteria bacterium]MBW2639501.1 ribbon-helix-helix protein, CopG family [Deltaproteobacteria bacterium]
MGQLTIYIDNDIEKKVNSMVKKSGMSKSKWVAELIRDKTANSWPDSVIQLAGAWKDIPTAEDIRKNMGRDADREKI